VFRLVFSLVKSLFACSVRAVFRPRGPASW
jgi:hypothetical protein